MARNPEFDNDRLELADRELHFKKHDLQVLAEALHLPKDSAILADKKKKQKKKTKNTKVYMRRASQIQKRETNIVA